jgi:hypothetical protein
MRRGIFAAVALTLLLVLGAVGIGVASYQAGAHMGYAQSAQLNPSNDGVPSTDSRVAPWQVMPGRMMYGRGFGMPFGHPFGILGSILACIFGLLFIGFIFRLIFGMAFRGRMGWGRHGMHGGWRNGGDVPPWADEMHRRMHEKSDANAPTQPKTDQTV